MLYIDSAWQAFSDDKPAKDILRRRFEDWYSQQITKQLVNEGNDIESVDLQPINLGLPVLKELARNKID